MAKRENSPTLYSYVKDYIVKLIISGKYPAHSQLPTEFQLMEELNVGRATVRAALSQLDSEGTIYKRQGVGTFVSERSKHYGLEPFLSMNFTMKHLGMNSNNEVILQEELEVDEENGKMLDRWPVGTEVYEIKRLRKSEGTLLAVEDNYYTPYAYSKLDLSTLDQSLAHNLLSNLDTPICHFDNSTSVRDCTEEEMSTFNIPETEKMVDYTRWIYFEGIEEPMNFVHFTIPSHILEFPFLG